MEYVEVRFNQSRKVYINGNESGLTNEILRIGEGTHSFDLGSPNQDYQPDQVVKEITGSNALDPIIIEFEEV